MKGRHSVPMALLLAAAFLVGPVVTAIHAEEKAGRVTGTVQMLNKDSKTIVVTGEAGNVQKQVVYDDQTKFTKDNKPATVADVQNGVRVICTGKENKDGQLVASRVDVRPSN